MNMYFGIISDRFILLFGLVALAVTTIFGAKYLIGQRNFQTMDANYLSSGLIKAYGPFMLMFGLILPLLMSSIMN